MKQWNQIYKNKKERWKEVHEDLPKILTFFKKNKVKKILDLGCGSGRHVEYFAKNGLEVYGIEIAREGIKATKDLLKKEGLQANLKVGSVYKRLPYKDNFFDAVVSTQTIHHGKIQKIRKVIKEIKRVLKTKGLIFITVRKKRCGKNLFKKISLREYVRLEGDERGVVHYQFNKNLLKKEFKGFRIINLWVESNKVFYCLLGKYGD